MTDYRKWQQFDVDDQLEQVVVSATPNWCG
jgi:hypothetical protein